MALTDADRLQATALALMQYSVVQTGGGGGGAPTMPVIDLSLEIVHPEEV